jgi:MFS family permease
VLQPYRDVLTRPGALAFSLAGLLARLPISTVGIGIVLAVSAQYGSYGLAGRISAVYVITHAICAPQLARLIDRRGQAAVMRPALAVTVAGLVTLVVVASVTGPTWALYAGAVVVGTSLGSVGALVRARWAHLLASPREIHTAYSLESVLDEVVFMVGPVLATVLATGVQPTAGIVVAAVAVVVGGLALYAQRGTEPPARAHDEVAGGHVMASAPMLGLAAAFVAMGAIFGATDVATVAFAREQGAPGMAGVVLAVFALGSGLAGFAYGARHWVGPLWRRFAVGMVVLAVGVALFGVVDSLVALALVMLAVGASIAPTLVAGNGLVAELVPAGRLTEGLTWVGTALGFGVSIGSSVAGSVIDGRGSGGGFVVVMAAGGLAVVATLASLRTVRAATRHVGVPQEDTPLPTQAEPEH